METCEILVHVYRREAMSRKCVYEWFKSFHEGKEMTEDEPCSGQPSTSRTPRNDRESVTNAGIRSATDAKIDCGGTRH